MLMMWNVEEGLNQIDKFFHDGDDFVKSGACLGAFILLAFILFYLHCAANRGHSHVVQFYQFFFMHAVACCVLLICFYRLNVLFCFLHFH